LLSCVGEPLKRNVGLHLFLSMSKLHYRNFVLILLAALLLLACELNVSFAQSQVPAVLHKVVFEVRTKEWGMVGNDCMDQVNFRLFDDGLIEFEICDRGSAQKKDLRITKQETEKFLAFVEASGFLEAAPKYYSGFSGTDVGVESAFIYRRLNGEKEVLVKNYVEASKSIPDSIHRIVARIIELRTTGEKKR